MGNFIIGGFLFTRINNKAKHIITIHSGGFIDRYSRLNPFIKYMIKRILKDMDFIITVNDDQKVFLENTLGIKADKISAIPAFIQPSYAVDCQIEQELQQMKKKYKKILTASGSLYRYYGFHIVLEAVKRICGDIGVVLVFYSRKDENYENELLRMIGSFENVKVYRDLTPGQYCTVLKNNDIFIRPTDRDGDSVSIREAGCFNNKIVASDCVKRPDGSILFQINDIESLVAALRSALDSSGNVILVPDDQDNAGKVEKEYKNVINS
jgi:hypothetical protein